MQKVPLIWILIRYPIIWVIWTSFLYIPALYIVLWIRILDATHNATFKFFGRESIEKSKFFKVIRLIWIVVVAGCCAFLCWKTFVLLAYLSDLVPKSWFPPGWEGPLPP